MISRRAGLVAMLALTALRLSMAGGPSAGLETLFRVQGPDASATIDATVLPEITLYVPAGQTPTPFLPPTRLKTTWCGTISLEVKGEYSFQAELRGEFKLEINGVVVLESTSAGTRTRPSSPVRLAKGANALTATFISPPDGDGFVRLFWVPKGGLASPIPASAFAHGPDSPELQRAAKLRSGRELYLNYRCAKCHLVSAPGAATPELDTDAPSFEGIGSRRTLDWMRDWISDPKALRLSARMPRVFHANARADAQAAAAFLSSLQRAASDASRQPPGAEPADRNEQIAAGQALFDQLHCAACHTPPSMGLSPSLAHPSNEARSDSTSDSLAHQMGEGGGNGVPPMIPLHSVARKFAPGTLASFLLKPSAHYTWIRMPDFKLTTLEAGQLAAYLEAIAPGKAAMAAAPDSKLVETGRRLVQTSGCLNCHALKLDNQFHAAALADLPASNWQSGCLAEKPEPNQKAPFFGFTSEQRESVRLFASTDRQSLTRDAPIEFAQRHVHDLQCRECHGKIEGFPKIDGIGGKLRPEWIRSFLAGQIPYRPRPWLSVRMPAFPGYASELATGLANLAGYPAATPPDPPIDMEAAAVGQKLVSAEGGLSCIACHAIGQVRATQVFENAGINLAHASSRLLKPYFERWLRNPLAIDPVTKMPAFFDEELRSVLADVYDGDGAKQIEAIWQYVRLGDRMPPPPGTQPSTEVTP